MLRHGSIRLLLRRGRICLLLGLRRGLGNVLCRRLRLRHRLGNVLCRRLRLRRGLWRLDGRGRGRGKTAHRPALGTHRTRCGIFYGGDCSALVTLEFLHEKILLISSPLAVVRSAVMISTTKGNAASARIPFFRGQKRP